MRREDAGFWCFALLVICTVVCVILGVHQAAQEREAQHTYCKAILERVPTAHDSLQVLHRFPECLP